MADQSYTRETEPDYKRRSYHWKTAIGLQQVDQLVPSQYLIETANANIAGEITLAEARSRIDDYYSQKPAQSIDEKRSEEADKVSTRIVQLLAEQTFTLSPVELLSIHRRLFEGLYDFAGKIRDYNISKKEWVLDGDTVLYGGANNIKETLDYDFAREKTFDYSRLSKADIVYHIAEFISGLWQIHAFGEGNTRAIAVFTIKYLRTFGLEVNNDTFEMNSWYFRNALVRANYTNVERQTHATSEYLRCFFGNLLLSEHHTLQNRQLKGEG